MVCKKCGKRMKGEPAICPHCGAPQTATVSLGAIHAAHESKKGKKKLTHKQLTLRIVLIVAAALAALAIVAVSILWLLLDSSIQHGSELDESELGINAELPTEGVINIALFGLDDRDKSADGHSDAIIILTIDQVHNKIKMTSLARDTLVPVDGYPSREHKTKLTHAFAYGGVGLAVKTINQNFGMNITDYVYVNFREFMSIIDYLGGVTINVEQRELNELNKHIYWMEIECDTKIARVKKAGEQRLTGGQALAYARVRKIDSDIERGNRQKDVLQAMFNEVKDLPLTKFPGLISKVLGICHTNMTSSEMMSIATWALTSGPEFVNYSLPDDQCRSWGGTHPNYAWVWIYDLKYATARLHDFIYETNAAASMTPTRYYLNVSATTAGSTTGGTTTLDPSGTDVSDPTGTDISDPSGTGTDLFDPTGTWTGTDLFDPTGTGTGTDLFDPTGTGTDLTDPTGTGTQDGGTETTGADGTSTGTSTQSTTDTTTTTTQPDDALTEQN